MRMAWMLSQTYDTPFNYCVELHTGVIMEVVSGNRPFLGDTSKYGFFEPGSVIRVTAPEKHRGRPFVKWVASGGSFSEPESRRPLFTVGAADAQMTAIYKGEPKLTVRGGVAAPLQPKPGQMVTVTVSDPGSPPARQVLHWTADGPLVLTQPHLEEIRFLMPSDDVTVQAHWTKIK